MHILAGFLMRHLLIRGYGISKEMFKRHTSTGFQFSSGSIPRSLPRSSLLRCPIDRIRIRRVDGDGGHLGFVDTAIHGLPMSTSVHGIESPVCRNG